MKAAQKTILFSRVTVAKTVHMWPVGVFANPTSAKTYAAYLKMAHGSSNVDMAKSLDPKTRLAEDGTLIPGLKLSIQTVAYEPTPSAGAGGDDVVEEEATA